MKPIQPIRKTAQVGRRQASGNTALAPTINVEMIMPLT